jgi:3-oxoacid CoA-transferase subunit A
MDPMNKDKVLQYSEPKEVHIFDGKPHVLETSIKADYAFIKGKVADTEGNIVFSKSAFNFNKDMAVAAKCVIAEVEDIVPAG